MINRGNPDQCDAAFSCQPSETINQESRTERNYQIIVIQLREAVVALGACRSDVPATAGNEHEDFNLGPNLVTSHHRPGCPCSC